MPSPISLSYRLLQSWVTRTTTTGNLIISINDEVGILGVIKSRCLEASSCRSQLNTLIDESPKKRYQVYSDNTHFGKIGTKKPAVLEGHLGDRNNRGTCCRLQYYQCSFFRAPVWVLGQDIDCQCDTILSDRTWGWVSCSYVKNRWRTELFNWEIATTQTA